MTLKKCTQCNRKFPSHLVQPFVFGSILIKNHISSCPICALKNINEMSGLPPKTPFKGEVANLMYKEAKEWLKS